MTNHTVNTQRTHSLPRVDQLTKDQEEARALPMRDQHLVVGGPGTGKSVVALMRAQRLARNEKDYLFLVYNWLLNWAGGQLVNDLKKATWDSWFRGVYNQHTGEQIPCIEPKTPGGYRPIDWAQTLKKCKEFSSSDRDLTFLVIDEGQDMPPAFYQSLFELGFENFYVVADQNQRITEVNSSRKDLVEQLLIKHEDVLELNTNFRNSYSTAALARHFCPNDPASPKPDLPEQNDSVEAPIFFEYENTQLDAVFRRILKLVDRDPRTLVGVITPNDTVRVNYVNRLTSVTVSLDNPRCLVQTYSSGQREEVRFDQGGVIVINQQSCKGLEFDFVVLPDIDQYWQDENDPDDLKRRFYVMVSRAKRRVIMLREKLKTGAIDDILPKDERLLQRWPKEEK